MKDAPREAIHPCREKYRPEIEEVKRGQKRKWKEPFKRSLVDQAAYKKLQKESQWNCPVIVDIGQRRQEWPKPG